MKLNKMTGFTTEDAMQAQRSLMIMAELVTNVRRRIISIVEEVLGSETVAALGPDVQELADKLAADRIDWLMTDAFMTATKLMGEGEHD